MAYEVRRYIDDPLTEEELRALVAVVGGDPTELVRGEVSDPTADGVVAQLLAEPAAMQRPVGVIGDRAVIARPAERIFEILD